MANQEHLDLLRQGVAAWNQWRAEHPDIRPDLGGTALCQAKLGSIHLSEADLVGTDFSFAHLEDAHLCGSHLRGVNFTVTNLRGAKLRRTSLRYVRLGNPEVGYADLSGADLSKTDLVGVDFGHTALSHATLYGADLSGANLSRAHLNGTDFTGALMAGTMFGDRDLRLVKGLEAIHHRFPSPVSINTIYLSEGLIPEIFLQGTGAPDTFIRYVRALVSTPVTYYTCFLSYSSRDDAFAKRLYTDLQDQGVRCWFAPEDMKIGDKMRPRIDEAIHLQDKLLLVLSEHALSSPWVEDEVEAALEKERRQQREVLFPVRLDDAVMQTSQAWAATLRRTRHIGDFTHWTEPQAYQWAFERLLRDLKQG